MNTIICELTENIKYANGTGSEIEGSFLEIEEPTGKIAHLVAILKSEIGQATKNAIEGLDLSEKENLKEVGDQDDDDPESIGESGYMMLTIGGSDMKKVFITFKEILRMTCKVAGEKAFTSSMYDRMAFKDVEKCLKSYIGNFMQA